MENLGEKIGWHARWRIDRFEDSTGKIADALQAGLSVFDAQQMFRGAYLGFDEWGANVALNEGLQELIDLICGLGSPTRWDSSNARLGVGNSNTTESATQTGLQGASKAFKAMDSGYPARSGQTAEWRATFGPTETNFSWQEFTVVNAADDSGKNLNRKVSDKGTKASGETWTLSLQITFS